MAQVNVMQEVIGSGILAQLPARQQTILLMLAGLAIREVTETDYRTAWAIQGKWAKDLGISRQSINGHFKALEAAGVITFVRTKRLRGGKGQPVNVYRIAYVEDLREIVYKLGKETQPERPQNANLWQNISEEERAQRAEFQRHLKEREAGKAKERCPTELTPSAEKVSSSSDTLVSSSSDTLPQKVSSSSDTEVVLDLEVGSKKGNSDFSHQEMGITSETATSKPSATPEEWFNQLRHVVTGERQMIIRRAVRDHGGHINGERLPVPLDDCIAYLQNRFEQMGVVQ